MEKKKARVSFVTPLQAEFAEMLLRQRHVRDFVVRLCHQHFKSELHGRTGHAEFPQEGRWRSADALTSRHR